MKITTRTQIERYIDRHGDSFTSTFLGCFSISHLPDQFPNKFPCSLIINDDETHWIALVLDEYVCFYFDSMGQKELYHTPPRTKRYFVDLSSCIMDRIQWHLTQWLKKHDWKQECYPIVANVKQAQEYDTEDCAIFCISFIKCVNSLETYWRFLMSFNYEDLKLNAYIAKKHLGNSYCHHKYHHKPNCTICYSTTRNIVDRFYKTKHIDQYEYNCPLIVFCSCNFKGSIEEIISHLDSHSHSVYITHFQSDLLNKIIFAQQSS